MVGIKFKLNDSLFCKDPQDTDLGRKIIKHSILLVDELGFEAFTFKKLATLIHSTEASVYRYFENKHLLLLYLTSLYWEWVSYLIGIHTLNISDSKEKLRVAINTIVDASDQNPAVEYVNEEILHRIVIHESAKAYHTIAVDDENRNGLFESYQTAVAKLALIIDENNQNFPYQRSLASSLFEMSNNQIYFAEHLPKLTDVSFKKNQNLELQSLLQFFAFKVLEI